MRKRTTVTILSGVLAAAVLAGLLAAGCSGTSTAPTTATVATAASGDEHGHTHDRANMQAVDIWKYHAWLTAHISSKEGNELDMLFETADDKDPKPVPLPVTKFTATAKRVGEDREHELVFEPAPADERQGDPPGQCSHFTAKAPWMKPDDVLIVTTRVPIEGHERKARWDKFEVKKYTHHAE